MTVTMTMILINMIIIINADNNIDNDDIWL